MPDDLGPKARQTIDVARNRMVVEVALYHGPQPLPGFGHWLMPASPKLLPYCFEFCGESLTDSLAIDREAAVSGPVGEGHEPEVQHVRCWGVGRSNSTDEAPEFASTNCALAQMRAD